MPQFEPSRAYDRHADGTHYYRRPLPFRDLVPAIAVAVGAGLCAFYIARLMIQRTPLRARGNAARARVGGARPSDAVRRA